jgi:hypothetical protein
MANHVNSTGNALVHQRRRRRFHRRRDRWLWRHLVDLLPGLLPIRTFSFSMLITLHHITSHPHRTPPFSPSVPSHQHKTKQPTNHAPVPVRNRS